MLIGAYIEGVETLKEVHPGLRILAAGPILCLTGGVLGLPCGKGG